MEDLLKKIEYFEEGYALGVLESYEVAQEAWRLLRFPDLLPEDARERLLALASAGEPTKGLVC